MFSSALEEIIAAKKIIVMQAENPDGDSLGSALALEELLAENGKDVVLYCAIALPKYLHYIQGWDRVDSEWANDADLAIIVDTAAEALLQQALTQPGVRHFLETHPVVILDHHEESSEMLPFTATIVNEPSAVATGELIYNIAKEAGWTITPAAAENLFIAIQSDSLGLTTPSTTAESYYVAADLVACGAVPATIEERRREYMKKAADILAYKGVLLQRVEYYLDGKLALVHIPWEEIEEYSDKYNPSVLVLDEMRMVEGVAVAVAIKTYPDGKLTGKIRVNTPVADSIAGYFGGGGHAYAAGFKVFETYDAIIPELLTATEKALREHEQEQEQPESHS